MASRRSAAKFFQEDIVRTLSTPYHYGIVLRCFTDAHESQIDPHHAVHDPLLRGLAPGEIGVSFFEEELVYLSQAPPRQTRQILNEDQFELVDRTFQVGDFCKRRIDEVQSGVIVSVDVKGRLQHVVSGTYIDGWRRLDDLAERKTPNMGEYVLYNDWVGQVVELFDESIADVGNNMLVRLPELSTRLTVGDRGNNILPQPATVPGIFGFFMNRNPHSDTVVSVNHTAIAVAWLALNQSLSPDEAQTRTRPQKFWFADDLPQLTLIRAQAEIYMRVGDKVTLKDPTGMPFTTHGAEGTDVGLVVVRTYIVKQTCTTVDVLWQDGTRETLPATDLIPYLNPDEFDTWPGEHVIFRHDGRPAVVQDVNAKDRTAKLLFHGGEETLVSLLELNIHGGDPSSGMGNEAIGVRLGDFVFIHPTTNGVELPRVPRIGEIEPWVREIPVNERGEIIGWRRGFADLGAQMAKIRADSGDTSAPALQPGKPSHSWFGEVTAAHLDGKVEVLHPDGTTANYPISRLTKLQDGMEQLEDMWDDEMSDGPDDDEGMWAMDEHGVWVPQSEEDRANGGDWEDTSDWDEDEAEEEEEEQKNKNETPTDMSPRPPMEVDEAILLTSVTSQPEERAPTNSQPPDRYPWKRFEILETTPADHAFFATPPAQPSKSFLARITKEYRVLASSLPESIMVRAYEDRTDLLRCLIIGPDNTPYSDAPFFIDWNLGSDFPNTPPIAHFFSFTNGAGRVNPNLYEEGKICLSILGTWAGDTSESWSAARSSLLQALVSIQGLVLVKEPWFCEPAYAALRGSPEGIVNSRFYNEKAFVLSHNFVLRAIESPLGGFDKEIQWIYGTDRRLAKIVAHAETLIETSKAAQDTDPIDEELAVPRLSAGGIMSLERTLGRLRTLLEQA